MQLRKVKGAPEAKDDAEEIKRIAPQCPTPLQKRVKSTGDPGAFFIFETAVPRWTFLLLRWPRCWPVLLTPSSAAAG
jgi:hypothetical protein